MAARQNRGRNAGLYQLSSGAAWAYSEYLEGELPAVSKKYGKAEASAKDKKRGLWQLKNPKAPWEYRKELKATAQK